MIPANPHTLPPGPAKGSRILPGVHVSISGIAALLVCSAIAVPAAAQTRSGVLTDTLAEVGSAAVTSRDLIERIELMPWEGKERAGMMDSVKARGLESLVAEQILALESSTQGVVDDSTLRRHTRSIERLMVRDELYKREVVARVSVEPDEVQEGIRRFASVVRILMLSLHNRSDAEAVSLSLLRGGRVDSVVAHPPGNAGMSIDTVVVTFGLLEKTQEDSVYALSRTKPVSAPLETPAGEWLVLLLIDRQPDPKYLNRSVPERAQIVTARIRKRKESARAQEYAGEILESKHAEAVPGTFSLFARTLFNILQTDSALAATFAGYRLDKIVEVAIDSLKPHLGDPLVRYEGGGMTVEDVLESYRTLQIFIPVLRRSDFRQRLNASIKEVVSLDLLAQEGYRQRLDQTDQVRHDVGTWARYWLARAMMAKLAAEDSVSSDEVLSSLISQNELIGKNYEVNVREILSDSLRESLTMMEKIIGGGDMKQLARANSKRTAWAIRDGESGYFPVDAHPVIGVRALDARIGALVGPVRVPEGYSLFTVLSVRSLRGDSTVKYDSLKAILRDDMLRMKVEKRVNGFVASAVGRYHVKFYYDRLQRTDIPPINMVTKRFIGFGGAMLAVPSLYPLWQWVQEAKGVEAVYP